jgi:hypothetical protein
LDTAHCAFRDDLVVTDGVSRSRRGVQSYDSHRKLVQYISYTDGEVFDSSTSGGSESEGDLPDDTDENARWYDHGTHLAGTVAGNSMSSSGDDMEQRGIAYDAKIVFMDVGGVDATTGKAFLEVPHELEREYLQPQVGVRLVRFGYCLQYMHICLWKAFLVA